MHVAGFHIDENRGSARLAEPFSPNPWDSCGVNAFDMYEKPVFEAAGSGLVSTAPDYARLLQMLINGGELDGIRIVGSKTIDLITVNYLAPEIKIYSPLMPPEYGFGLGLAVRTHAGLAPSPAPSAIAIGLVPLGPSFASIPKRTCGHCF